MLDGCLTTWNDPYEIRRKCLLPPQTSGAFACGGRWSPDAKIWLFPSEASARAVQKRLIDLGFRVRADFVDPADELRRLRAQVRQLTAELRRTSTGSDDASLEQFLERFGLPAYRSLTKIAHPDAGGDHAWMSHLNQVWDRIGRSA